MGMAKKNKLKHELMPSRPMGSATNGPEQDGALVAVVDLATQNKPDNSGPRRKKGVDNLLPTGVDQRSLQSKDSDPQQPPSTATKINTQRNDKPENEAQPTDQTAPATPPLSKQPCKARARARKRERAAAEQAAAATSSNKNADTTFAGAVDSGLNPHGQLPNPWADGPTDWQDLTSPGPSSGKRAIPSRDPRPSRMSPAVTYHPIRPSATRHLTHPFRHLHPDTLFDIPAIRWLENAQHTHGPSAEYLEMAAEAPAYYTSEIDEFVACPPWQRKLLVQDLNGAILVRAQYKSTAAQRTVSPRPFLTTYLDYLFKPVPPSTLSDKKGKGKVHPRPWECFVWSSATPPSCADMVKHTFDAHEASTSRAHDDASTGRILGIWTRQNMGLSHQQYNNKSDTVKDLAKVCDMFKAQRTGRPVPGVRFPEPPFEPNLYNVLLLDDSVKKAIPNPFSHVPIPEYAKAQRHAAERRVQNMQGVFDSLTPRTFDGSAEDQAAAVQERVTALQFAFSGSPYDVINEFQPIDEAGDSILLCVIGILEELKDVLCIPAWTAAGGLSPGWDISSITPRTTWEELARLDIGTQGGGGKGIEGDARPTSPPEHRLPGLELPPTDPQSQQWYASAATRLYWLRRGLLAVEARKLDVRLCLRKDRQDDTSI